MLTNTVRNILNILIALYAGIVRCNHSAHNSMDFSMDTAVDTKAGQNYMKVLLFALILGGSLLFTGCAKLTDHDLLMQDIDATSYHLVNNPLHVAEAWREAQDYKVRCATDTQGAVCSAAIDQLERTINDYDVRYSVLHKRITLR